MMPDPISVATSVPGTRSTENITDGGPERTQQIQLLFSKML